MNLQRSLLPSVALLAAAAMAASVPAQGASNRTFVASNGNDANAAANCPIAAPCRSFAGALAVTNGGGEILVLDSGGFGPVTIDRSVSITGPDGVYSGITVTTGNGVTISTAAVDVVLKGLTINGLGGANGIYMTDGATLRIENCTVTGFGSDGTAAINISTAAAKVFIWDTVVAKSNAGIVLDGGVNADISRVKAVNNIYQGIAMAGGRDATTVAVVSDSIASGNGNAGIVVVASGGGINGGFAGCGGCIRKMTVVNTVANGNGGSGMVTVGTGSSAILNVANSVISHNATSGLNQFAGILTSAQNNVLTDNATQVSGVLTTGGILY